MQSANAILLSFVKSLSTSGRATRREFFTFAPLAVLMPIIVASLIDWKILADPSGVWRIMFVLAAACPLIVSMGRRLQDTDEPGHQAFFPFMPFIKTWISYVTVLSGAMASVSLGSFGVFLFFGVLSYGLHYVIPIVAGIVTLFLASSLLGMLPLPSQPGPNKYGPNPHEVSP